MGDHIFLNTHLKIVAAYNIQPYHMPTKTDTNHLYPTSSNINTTQYYKTIQHKYNSPIQIVLMHIQLVGMLLNALHQGSERTLQMRILRLGVG